MALAFLFFGHHAVHGSLLDRFESALHAVPMPIWAAVLGIVAAVLTPILNHYLEQRRARMAAAREDQLRSQEDERRAVRVRADLLVRLRSHCANLQPLVERGTVDADLWQAAHDALLRRARDAEVIDALGATYQGFMQAIHAEAVAINAQRARHGDAAAREFREATSSNVARVVAGYAPFVRDLGDPKTAALLDRFAERVRTS